MILNADVLRPASLMDGAVSDAKTDSGVSLLVLLLLLHLLLEKCSPQEWRMYQNDKRRDGSATSVLGDPDAVPSPNGAYHREEITPVDTEKWQTALPIYRPHLFN